MDTAPDPVLRAHMHRHPTWSPKTTDEDRTTTQGALASRVPNASDRAGYTITRSVSFLLVSQFLVQISSCLA
jgi:hypothetical protein